MKLTAGGCEEREVRFVSHCAGGAQGVRLAEARASQADSSTHTRRGGAAVARQLAEGRLNPVPFQQGFPLRAVHVESTSALAGHACVRSLIGSGWTCMCALSTHGGAGEGPVGAGREEGDQRLEGVPRARVVDGP